MNAFNAVTVVSDIIIAFAGLVFTILEYRKKKNEERRLEKEKEIIGKMTEEIGTVNKGIEITNELINGFNEAYEMSRTTTDAGILINRFMEPANEFVGQIQNVISSIEALYEELLRNESNFSLSYGFDRIINACRQILLVSSTQDFSKLSLPYKLQYYIKNAQDLKKEAERIMAAGGNLQPSDQENLGILTNNMYQMANSIELDLQTFRPYLIETKIKFEKYNESSKKKK